MQGTAGYVTRMSGGVGGREGPRGFFLSRLVFSRRCNAKAVDRDIRNVYLFDSKC